MDSFFERYGRLIIVAVAVCFVLLLFTPLKNTIGNNINGFVSNFANLAVYLRAQYGGLDMQFLYHDCGIRPTFTVDLTKVDYKVVDTVNYK